MTTATLAELEAAEYHALDAMQRLPEGDRRRVQLRTLLDRARVAKAASLTGHPGILRKSGVGIGPIEFGKSTDPRERQAEEAAVVDMIKATLHRQLTGTRPARREHEAFHEWLQARAGR